MAAAPRRSPGKRSGVSPAWALVVVLPALVTADPTMAVADETTGTWTGTVELLGNYYYERSTRVVAPEVSARLEAPDGTRIRTHYLVDAITSASQATGVQVDRAFTETRHEVGLGAGHELDLGDAQLDLDADVRFSHEPDYRALAFDLRSRLYLANRATVLSLTASYWHDRVGRVLRFADEAPSGGPGGDLDPWPGNIDGARGIVDLEQTVTPKLQLGATYDFAYLRGFLSNAYRSYTVDGQPFPEDHPGERVRHALRGRMRAALGDTTSLHLFLSVYRDSWSVEAVEPELALRQRVGDLVVLKLHYDFYAQTEAFFNGDDGAYEVTPNRFGTNDPKMTAFREQTLGGEITLRLPFLETTPWSATASIAYDAIFERTNRFGPGVVAQARLRVPFE